MTQNAALRLAIASSVTALLVVGASVSRPNVPPAPPQEVAVCEASPAYTNNSEQNDIADETVALASDDDSEKQVRKATTEFIKEKYPSSKVEGVFTLSFARGNLYIAGADTTTDEKRRTIDLLVRRYVRRNGGVYWRAESLSGEEATVWMKKAEADRTE